MADNESTVNRTNLAQEFVGAAHGPLFLHSLILALSENFRRFPVWSKAESSPLHWQSFCLGSPDLGDDGDDHPQGPDFPITPILRMCVFDFRNFVALFGVFVHLLSDLSGTFPSVAIDL